MALINRDTTLNRVRKTLNKIEPPAGVEILSYKRNRGVAILRLGEDKYFVRQKGYEEAEYTVGGEELAKILKLIIKLEFPRSRKLRIYALAGPEELDGKRKKL